MYSFNTFAYIQVTDRTFVWCVRNRLHNIQYGTGISEAIRTNHRSTDVMCAGKCLFNEAHWINIWRYIRANGVEDISVNCVTKVFWKTVTLTVINWQSHIWSESYYKTAIWWMMESNPDDSDVNRVTLVSLKIVTWIGIIRRISIAKK